jgi:FixJ family two-component response regulator
LHNHLIVAIVDDDDSVRLATSRLVRSLGWEARTYASPLSFLSAETGEVACIISDVQMPGMSGIEMQRTLVGDQRALPIIFITAFCTDAIRKEALAIGARSCLTKPVDGAAVQAFLEQVAEDVA